MDAIVTARVPKEIKDQVNDILHSLGSSPTELINKAYLSVLRTKRLPETSASMQSDLTHRTLSKKQLKSLKETLARMYLGPFEEGEKNADESALHASSFEHVSSQGADSFKVQLNEARDKRYASFS